MRPRTLQFFASVRRHRAIHAAAPSISRSTPFSRVAEPRQHRTDQSFAQFACERSSNTASRAAAEYPRAIAPSARRRDRRSFSSIENRASFSRSRSPAFEGYDFGSFMLAIDEGAFQRQIDEACDQVRRSRSEFVAAPAEIRGRRPAMSRCVSRMRLLALSIFVEKTESAEPRGLRVRAG